jgi:hypothetical protein
MAVQTELKMDGQTDLRKLIVGFGNFANAPKEGK